MRTQRILTLAVLVAAAAVGACKETVVNVLKVASVDVSGGGGTLVLGQTVQLSATPRDNSSAALTNRSITWSSSNPSVASVSGTGLVQAVGTGSANISAMIEGVTGSAAISVNNPTPSITSILPASIVVGGSAFQLTVTGTGFVAGSVVAWNGADRTTQYVDASTLKASITAADVATAGSFNVTVRNPAPGGGTSPARAFAVNNPPPVITSLAPNSALYGGAAFQLTVTGTGFMPASVVRWRGQDRTTSYVSATTLKISVTAADIASPALIDVTVVNPAPAGGSDTAQFVARIPPPGSTTAAGGYSTCAVRGNGEAYCWGSNSSGQLGDGTSTDRAAPTRVATTVPFVSIVMGRYHACGLTSWGVVYCWGGSSYIGTGGSSSLTPVPVAGTQIFVQLSAGNYHTCGVTAAGGLFCWGYNSSGQLGDGTSTTRTAPVPVVGGHTWARVFGGNSHTCALTTGQQAYCWGANWSGQLGDGTTTNHLTPAPVSGGLSFTMGTAGGSQTCALTPGGTAYCWGWSGALGSGSGSNNSLTPVAVAGGQLFATIAAGDSHTCGVTQQGSAYCWGRGDDGELGNDTTLWAYSPVAVHAPAMRDIAAADYHSCGITTNGTAYCWGARSYGTLGDGQVGLRSSPTAVSGASAGYATVAVGSNFSCGLNGGVTLCWGFNGNGQLGNGTYINQLVPSRASGGFSFSRIGAGSQHACALDASGAAYCWGAGWNGQLGNASSTSSNTPTPVAGGYTWLDVEPGFYFTCGVTSAGEVKCWGDNYYGQLGDGTTNARSVPTAIAAPGGQTTFSKVSAGAFHACVVTAGGQLYCWGYNTSGQIGDGSTTNRPTPVLIDLGSPAASVSAGNYHTCALTTAGAAFCWGNGTTRPAAVAGGVTFRSISAGAGYTCGLTAAGGAYCWGTNGWGQLGNGGFSYASTPTAVAGGESYLDVEARYEHTCGVTTAGAVRCWGHLHWGELGIGVSGIVLTPTAVQGPVVFNENPCGARTCTQAVASLPRRRSLPPAGIGLYHAEPLPRPEAGRPTEACLTAREPCRLDPPRMPQ